MTSLTDTQVVTASGGLVELGYSQITSDVNITSVTAGSGTPIISALTVVCDGGPVLVEFFAPGVVAPSTSGGQAFLSLYQDGSEKSRYWANISNPAAATQYAPAYLSYRTTPTAGSHTFDVRAFVSATTGTPRVSAGTATTAPSPAFLRVSKIVTATQWPAVTTGTIICTSSTRPASPFEGQTIYETDTDIEYRWTGSLWLPISPAPSVRIKAGAAQSGIGSGSWVKMTFPTATVVNPYNFTVSSGTVTIPSGYGGMYAVQSQVQWDSNASGDRLLAFGLSGGSYASDGISGQTSPSTVSAYYRATLSGLMQLNSGSSYTLWGLQGSGSNRSTDISFMENWLHLVKVD